MLVTFRIDLTSNILGTVIRREDRSVADLVVGDLESLGIVERVLDGSEVVQYHRWLANDRSIENVFRVEALGLQGCFHFGGSEEREERVDRILERVS